MINKKTGGAFITRDIQWTNKFIGELKTRNVKEYLIDITPEKQADVEAKPSMESDNQPEEIVNDEIKNMKVSKVVRSKRELKALQEDNRLQSEQQEGLFCFFIKEELVTKPIEEPSTFNDALYHEDDVERKKWQDAINLEFNQMLKNEV